MDTCTCLSISNFIILAVVFPNTPYSVPVDSTDCKSNQPGYPTRRDTGDNNIIIEF